MLRKVGGSYLLDRGFAKPPRRRRAGRAGRGRGSGNARWRGERRPTKLRAPMTGLKAASAIFVLSLGSVGSPCHGQQSVGTGDTAAAKDPNGDVTLPGVDTSMLTPREKREWSTYVSALMAPCSDTPVSIAQCVQEKRSCSKCATGAKYVLRGVRDGMSQEQIEKSYHNRFDADRVKNVLLDGSPALGAQWAPVTVLGFAHFER